MARQFAKKFYRSKKWQQTRQYILMRDNYLCVLCGKPAEEVHHIVHLTEENIDAAEVNINSENLISLCRDCHMKIHESERRAGWKRKDETGNEYAFDENGMLVRVSK